MNGHLANGFATSAVDFLRRGAGAAVALPSMSAILAACTKPGSEPAQEVDLVPRPDSPVTLPMNGDRSRRIPRSRTGRASVYNWDAYLYKAILQRFVEEYSDHDITFKAVTTFNNMDEAVAKMQAGQVEADVFFPTIDVVPRLAVAGLLQPLNHDLVPNLEANVWPVYQNPYYDQQWRYTRCRTSSTTPASPTAGTSSPTTRSARWSPTTSSGTQRIRTGWASTTATETRSRRLLRNGIEDINTGKQADLDIAREDLLEMIDLVNPRDSTNGAYKLLPRGDFDVHISWSGDIVGGMGLRERIHGRSTKARLLVPRGPAGQRQRCDRDPGERAAPAARPRVPQLHARLHERDGQLLLDGVPASHERDGHLLAHEHGGLYSRSPAGPNRPSTSCRGCPTP